MKNNSIYLGMREHSLCKSLTADAKNSFNNSSVDVIFFSSYY